MEVDSEKHISLPQKRFYRQRAHSNPIADHCFEYPSHPSEYEWEKLYPGIGSKKVEFADIGCGYGGFLVKLGELFPEKYAIGMEIRVKVSDYVIDRINALRQLHKSPAEGKTDFNNIACIRTNAMKYLPNFFEKGQLTKMFFLYPDPHFKKAKHKWRIINQGLLSEYAYVLSKGALVYTITDVEDLHDWFVKHFDEHPLYERVGDDILKSDVIVDKLYETSEEGLKVSRNKGSRWLAVYRRL